MLDKEKLKNDVLTVSKGYVSLTELEIECLVDILSYQETINLAFIGTSRETNGIFVFTDKRVIFIARTKSMKDFFCLNYEYEQLGLLEKQTSIDDANLFVLLMMTEEGELFHIDRLTSERADLLYRNLLKLLGEEDTEPTQGSNRKRGRFLSSVMKVFSVLGIVFVVLVMIGIFTEEGEESFNQETTVEEFEHSFEEREINFVDDGVVEVEGIMQYEYIDYFFSDTVLPPNSEDDFSGYEADDELFTFLIVKAEVTNISKNKPLNITVSSPLYVPLVIDNVHDYYPIVDYLKNNESEFAYLGEIEPNNTVTAYYMYRIPKKYIDSPDRLVLNFERLYEDYSSEYITSFKIR